MTKELILPVLPLRDIVVFPYMVVPLFVGRSKSIKALEDVMSNNKKIMLLTQKNPDCDDPEYSGCISSRNNSQDITAFKIT
jgi:ATP-dependent Lon protease